MFCIESAGTHAKLVLVNSVTKFRLVSKEASFHQQWKLKIEVKITSSTMKIKNHHFIHNENYKSEVKIIWACTKMTFCHFQNLALAIWVFLLGNLFTYTTYPSDSYKFLEVKMFFEKMLKIMLNVNQVQSKFMSLIVEESWDSSKKIFLETLD